MKKIIIFMMFVVMLVVSSPPELQANAPDNVKVEFVDQAVQDIAATSQVTMLHSQTVQEYIYAVPIKVSVNVPANIIYKRPDFLNSMDKFNIRTCQQSQYLTAKIYIQQSKYDSETIRADN